MNRLILTATGLMIALATPAYAKSCADDIKVAQKAVSVRSLGPEVRDLAGDLIKDAVLAQKKGDGQSCNITLAQVQVLLGIVEN